MSAAAAPALRSARDAMQSGAQNPASVGLNLNQPHYFVQFGWDVLDVDTNAIPNRRLLRGEITPCLSYAQKANIVEIREGELLPGSEEVDRDGNVVWGKYARHAHYEAERLRHNEEAIDPMLRCGLVEIEDADGLLERLYKNLDLNAVFYPQGLDRLPEKNEVMIAHLRQRRVALETESVAGMPEHFRPVLLDVADQLIAAAEKADRIQTSRLEWTHSCMKLSPADTSGNFKRVYDKVDEEMLRRTDVPRVHSADVTTARALDKLATPREDGALTRMVELQARQLEMLQAERDEARNEARKREERYERLLERLLSQNGTPEAPKPEPAKPAATPAKK